MSTTSGADSTQDRPDAWAWRGPWKPNAENAHERLAELLGDAYNALQRADTAACVAYDVHSVNSAKTHPELTALRRIQDDVRRLREDVAQR